EGTFGLQKQSYIYRGSWWLCGARVDTVCCFQRRAFSQFAYRLSLCIQISYTTQ
ncbi:hypothetical protein MKW98_007092, partial [Papaver atlanticum]